MSPLSTPEKKKDRCLGGTIHLNAGIRIVVSIGTLVILALVVALYLKFRKALFVLLIPTAVTVMTVVAIITRRHHLVWPIIATSMFHVVLACYAILIFSFYFFFKPFYIIMVLNWAFDTLHTDKTDSYYIQCSVIFASLTIFLVYNCWQAIISLSYQEHLRLTRPSYSPRPTVLIVNKQPQY
ncbi:unnamed protein product [Cylicocyclus nassatus]|uniref:Uncharacterized protein n=1 Tax=Cylicocyclus nassatus TaxID=53992 RepID=A0AA36GMS9_CYLNA|nr:unnamed protein product [Cylicocyclus nassatus]